MSILTTRMAYFVQAWSKFCTKKMRTRFRRLKKIATIAEASFIVKSDFYDNKHFFFANVYALIPWSNI